MYKNHFLPLFAALIFASPSLFSQNYRALDSASYAQYVAKDWGSVMETGQVALSEGHDYYYLRMRMGVAAYELAKYRTAIRHFEKALQFNPEDAFALNYLYYAYLFAGRTADAQAIAIERPHFFGGVYVEGGFKSAKGLSTVGGIRFFQVGLQHNLGKRLSVYHGFTTLSHDFFEEIEQTVTSGGGFGGGAGSGGTTFTRTFLSEYTFRQQQYYLGGTFTPAKGWHLKAGWHFLHVDVVSEQINDYALSLSLNRDMGLLGWTVGGTYSELNGNRQQQLLMGLSFYPLGNLDFYLSATGTLHFQEGARNEVLFGRMGVKLAKKTWLEGFGSVGEIYNFTEADGFVVFNLIDTVNARLGGSLVQGIGTKHRLSLTFQHENKTQFATELDYQHQAVMLGLFLGF